MTDQKGAHPDTQYGLLTTVAAVAGVSLSTVSKVVHRRRDVGAATRARVEGLLAQHGYVRPGEPAAAGTQQIVAVFRDLSGPYALEVVRGVVDAAGALGVDVVTGTTGVHPMSYWLEKCRSDLVAGLIVVISMLTDEDQRSIVEHQLPVVLIDPLSAPSQNIPSIGVTNWAGSKEAVSHLIHLGHRRIGMIAGRSHSLTGAARLHGYRAALEEADIDYDPALVRSTDFDFAEALVVSRRMLLDDAPPTAVFAASDAQALGVLEAARQAGLSVPADLSVMSFDDTLVAAMACPPLSAMRQPFEELGREATRILMQLSRGERLATDRIELATRLILRSSTAPPRDADGG